MDLSPSFLNTENMPLIRVSVESVQMMKERLSSNSVLASVATPVLMSLAPMIGAPTFDGLRHLLAIKLATGLSMKSVGRRLVLEIS